ncbi:ATP-binding cassette domain-containing protein (plasmid) [Weissella confusa]|uniref:ABC transporter ATP-binding protein n=1 Tax=Weissella confusa TaxID=1583 RepID=UPI001C6F7B0D|nr:ATP-binding cassette domain-containing protein [Weissella confusa]QYU58994.1 ATP-binding cassette domain-containing protein [Weissella confusa]QYU59007.1 ATP-binding cassette domain-containing protein [Weissella confusa]
MIRVNGLQKEFGNKVAVQNLSFNLDRGQTLGLIGQNGAGKTTTFRMMLDFIKPTHGTILFDEKPISPAIKQRIGFLPEERGLYQKETIENQILYFASLHGMSRYEARIKLKEWMDRLNVVGLPTDKVQSLSKGNAQKIQLIATTIFSPDLLILDEPFTGLDPVNAGVMMAEIERIKRDGTAIIFSSHNMSGVEKISDEILMLGSGKTLLQGGINEIREGYGRTELYIESNLTESYLKSIESVLSIERHGQGLQLKLANEDVGRFIFKKAVEKNGYVPVFSQQPPTLDEIFRLMVTQNKETKR